MINIYVANLSKYNEGRLVGEWLELPMHEDNMNEILDKILGSDEEYAIHDYECEINIEIKEYTNIFTLNETAERLEDFDIDIVNALLEIYSDIDEVIEVIENGDFIILNNIKNEENLGYAAIEELDMLEIPEHLKNYFDYQKYGYELTMDNWNIVPELSVAVYTY